jgi:hypothetical protein
MTDIPTDGRIELKKDRANARWSILRNALLQKAQSTSQQQQQQQHSIHRFAGYQLLSANATAEQSGLEPVLKRFEFNAETPLSQNIKNLEMAILALAACYPKGKCIDIENCFVPATECITTIKERLQSVVHLVVVDDKSPSGCITVLVQEKSSALTKYTCRQYALDQTCSLFTREPLETRLSLKDLVSHRTTGVDNTGNICVWDSERTLAYLLYHHLPDFSALTLTNGMDRVLELGTGMAGLAAISLGLRLVQQQESDNKIYITLTDGHSDGVENNLINQYLTKAYCSIDEKHPYHSLTVSAQVLLWTTEAESTLPPQDVVVVSDCTHFQKFHGALAVTMLRSLRVGGIALFCQPNRGDSLQNFIALLTTTSTSDLVSLEWIQHPRIEEANQNALEEHKDVYDENLHYPRILIVIKLRKLTNQDREDFMLHQQTRN